MSKKHFGTVSWAEYVCVCVIVFLCPARVKAEKGNWKKNIRELVRKSRVRRVWWSRIGPSHGERVPGRKRTWLGGRRRTKQLYRHGVRVKVGATLVLESKEEGDKDAEKIKKQEKNLLRELSSFSYIQRKWWGYTRPVSRQWGPSKQGLRAN